MVCTNFQQYLEKIIDLNASEFQQLLPFIEMEEVSKGSVLDTRVTSGGNQFFVNKGLLRFYSIGAMGRERIIQFAPENWFIGHRTNLYEIDAEPSMFSYHIEAIEDSVVIRLTHDFAKEIERIQPNFARINERLLQNHISHLQHRINLLIGSSVQERYEDFIRMYPDLLQRVPQWMIASYLGVTPEGLSRVRNHIAKGK